MDAIMHWPWTALAPIIAIFGLFLSSIILAHRRWKKGWLSELIAIRLSSARKKPPLKERSAPVSWRRRIAATKLAILESWDSLETYFSGKFITELTALRVPSLVSFAVFTILIATFFLIPRPPSFSILLHWQDWWPRLTRDLDHGDGRTEDRIIGAFTGLAVVVIALIVFVAESIRDDNDFERKRILVRISWLWPLGLAATLIPFGFLWSAARGFTLILESTVAVFTLVAFANIIRSLLDPEKRESDRLALLRSRVRATISESIRERIGNSIFLQQLGQGRLIDTLQYTVWRTRIEGDPGSYLFIDAPEDGWITDIQLEELKKLGDRLDRYAREVLGFSLRDSGPRIEAGAIGPGPSISPTTPFPKREAYLLKRYREQVPPDSIFYAGGRSLFALPEPFARNPALLADIRATIPHIFRFTREEPSSIAMRREMQGTKDQLAASIRAHALGAIDELRQSYLHIAEEFLSMLDEFGGGYSAEQAEKERGALFESWTEIRWLWSDLRELIIIAVDAENPDILSTIAFLPFGIASRAIQARDNYLFQQFYQFAPFFYLLATEQKAESRNRDLLVDRSWRWPKEIADFYIARELDNKAKSPDELEQMRGFALYCLRVFQDLLKLIADKRDVSTFATVAREFRGLFGRFRSADDQPNIAILHFQLDHAQNDEQRASRKTQLELQEKRQDIAATLNMAVHEIFLALGGRILAQRLEVPQDAKARQLFDTIISMLPNTVEGIAATFAAASGGSASDAWGWNQWDVIADGQAHWVDLHTNLNQIFAVRALQLLALLPPEVRANVQLPVSQTLTEMAREGNPQGLLATLRAIEEQPERWEIVLDQEARNCIGILRERLSAALTAQRELAAEATRNAPLDQDKLREFRAELVRSFIESSRLRGIFDAKGAIVSELSTNPEVPVRSLGFSQIDDKNAFIAQENVSYAGWGRGYGQGIAQGEDEEVFAEMIGAIKTNQTTAPGAVVTMIGRAVSEMMPKDPIILQSLVFDARYAEIDRNPAFTPKYNPDIRTSWRDFNGFMGLLTFGTRQVPVFDTFVRRNESQNKILILDASQFLRWRQFAPDREPNEPTYADGKLLIRVIDLNMDTHRRNEIIAQNPPWLAGEQDRIAYLRGRVLIDVYEKFHIDIRDASAGICLTFSGPLEDG